MNFIQGFKYHLAQPKTSWQLVSCGVAVGLFASLVIILLRLAIAAISSFYNAEHGNFVDALPYQRLFLPLGAVTFILMIVWATKHKFHRVGIPFVLYRQRKYYGYIPLGNTLNQFFSAIAAIAGGFSVGREGPAVHVGAGSASVLAQFFKLPNNAKRILAASGIAAGISASFNSPLAAVVFVLEVVLRQYRIHLFLPIMVSALIGTALSRMVFGDIHQYTDLFMPQITIHSLLPFLLLGITVGLAAVIFNRSLLKLIKHSSPISIYIRLPLAGFIMGIIGWALPQTMGSEYGALNVALTHNPEISLILMMLIGKFVATIFSLGLGIPGGVIGVLYAIGALLGSFIVWSLIPFFPQLTEFAPMAVLICMVAMMATCLNAPLAALVAVLELSENSAIIFPSLLVVVPAILLSQQVFKLNSLFYAQLDLQKLNYKVSPIIYELQDTGVVVLMRRKFNLLEASSAWANINSSLPMVVHQNGDHGQYLMPSHMMGLHSDQQTLLTINTLTDNATLAEAYQLLSPQQKGYVLILAQGTNIPVGVLSWRALRKHLHKGRGY